MNRQRSVPRPAFVMHQFCTNGWRGPRPRSFLELQKLGFNRVIDLQSGAEDFLTESKYEHQRPETYGITRFSIPCDDVFPPDNGQVLRFISLMDSEFKTYVHCHSGVDRTGYMVAVHRMAVQDWTFRRAHKEWVEMGRHPWYFWWRWWLKDWSVNG